MVQIIKQNNFTDFLLYKSSDWEIKVDVLLKNENIWLSQKKIAELFEVQRPAITKHIKNIFETWELNENSVSSILEHTANDGKNYKTKFYNLDLIIAVWYRVNSKKATDFRIWTNKILKEYIIKWFSINEEKLKNPDNPFWSDYFEELEEKIRDIRTSERRFYQKITDIYALSIDYDKNSELTKNFFTTVQNKLHFWIHWKTAAELIYERADSKKENMWITCIKKEKLKKSDIFIAKNYLKEEEIQELNLIVEQYLAFAKNQARKKVAMTMKDWILKLDDFLRLNEKEILQNKWAISKKLADDKVENEYLNFRKEEMKNYISDFDKETEQFLKNIN